MTSLQVYWLMPTANSSHVVLENPRGLSSQCRTHMDVCSNFLVEILDVLLAIGLRPESYGKFQTVKHVDFEKKHVSPISCFEGHFLIVLKMFTNKVPVHLVTVQFSRPFFDTWLTLMWYFAWKHGNGIGKVSHESRSICIAHMNLSR